MLKYSYLHFSQENTRCLVFISSLTMILHKLENGGSFTLDVLIGGEVVELTNCN